MKILTVNKAREEIKRLQHFIKLVESYEANNIEKWIIREYAYTSSMREVVARTAKIWVKNNGVELDHKFVKNVIVSRPKNELHRLMRANYRLKIKANRRK